MTSQHQTQQEIEIEVKALYNSESAEMFEKAVEAVVKNNDRFEMAKYLTTLHIVYGVDTPEYNEKYDEFRRECARRRHA